MWSSSSSTSSRKTRFSSRASARSAATACSESLAWLPRTRSGSSAKSSPSASVTRPLPGAAMRSRAPALAALVAPCLRAGIRRRRLDHVHELRRRLRRQRLLGLGERNRARVEAPATTAVDRHTVGVARKLLPLRELGLALLPDREQRRRDEDRRVGTRRDTDEEREREVLQGGATQHLERGD